MKISDAEIFELLRNLDLDKSKTHESFINICKFTVPELVSGNIISKLIWDSLITWNEKSKTVSMGPKSKKFIRKYKCRKRRDTINEYTKFLKNLSWLLAFIVSILANIFYVLKFYGVF